MESVNGGAFVSFSTFLGNPGAPHIDPRKFNMTARTSRHPEGHQDSQNGGNPHFRAAPKNKKKSKRKTERDNKRAAEFQSKKKKEDTKQAAATGTEKTSEKGNETEAASEKDKEIVEVEESEMTISSLESSPESRKFSLASPLQETLQ